MRHTLQMRQWVPYALPHVFNFFSNPNNLPPLMPGWQKARIDREALVAPPLLPAGRVGGPVQAAGEGSLMRITFRPVPLLPLRIRWDAEIVEFAWDDHFCDMQNQGPFGYWRHCHSVQEKTRDGVEGTLVTDKVTYAFPGGVLGEVANLLGGAAQVRAIFRFRQRQLIKLLPRDIARNQR